MRPSFANHDDAKNRFASRQSKREAERRKAHAIHVRVAQTSVRELAPLIRSAAARPFGARPPFGAHACGTRHRLSPRWLSPRTGFPENGPHRCFARLALLSSVKHAPCRPVFLPVEAGEPGPPGTKAISAITIIDDTFQCLNCAANVVFLTRNIIGSITPTIVAEPTDN